MEVLRGPTGADEATELAIAHALLRRIGATETSEISEILRIYRPAAPAVVFGRRDTRLPGFAAAARVAREAGFQIAVRATGGRAVAYTENAIVLDHVRRQADAKSGVGDRFVLYGHLIAATLRDLGVDARVGAVPGEYCPGAQSVNARGVRKLVGTAQRVVRDAWLFSTLVCVDDHRRLRPVLREVYGHLGLEFDEASVGSVAGEVPGIGVAEVEEALRRAFGVYGSTPRPVGARTLAAADNLVDQHRL